MQTRKTFLSNALSSLPQNDSLLHYPHAECVVRLFASNSILNALEVGSDYGLCTSRITYDLVNLSNVGYVDFTDKSFLIKNITRCYKNV